MLGFNQNDLTAVADTVNFTKLMENMLKPQSTLERVYNGLTTSPAFLGLVGILITLFVIFFFTILRSRFFKAKTASTFTASNNIKVDEICTPRFKGYPTAHKNPKKRARQPRNRRIRQNYLSENPIVLTVVLDGSNASIFRSWASLDDSTKKKSLRNFGNAQSEISETASQTMNVIGDFWSTRQPVEVVDKGIQVSENGDYSDQMHLKFYPSSIDKVMLNFTRRLKKSAMDCRYNDDVDDDVDDEERDDDGQCSLDSPSYPKIVELRD